MLKKFCLIVVVALCMVSAANAGVVSMNAFQSFKDFINESSPAIGGFYDFMDNDYSTMFTVSLYDFKKEETKLADISAGYLVPDKGVLVGSLNIAGLAEIQPNIPVLNKLGQLGVTLCIGGGYDFREKDAVAGVGSINFRF